MRVEETGAGEFRVTVRDGGIRTTHHVTASLEERERFGPGAAPAELVRESFRFLLEREPAESILSRFALSEIERYFPEYPEEIRARLRAASPPS